MKRRIFISVATALVLAGLFFINQSLKQPLVRDAGVTLNEENSGDIRFCVVRVDLDKASVDLCWNSSDGKPFGTFERLRTEVESTRGHLIFATNAGIFAPGYIPLGLHVENGQELVPVNRSSGPGNFYLKPNGVFLVDSSGARIIKSGDYQGTSPDVRLATQSGPLLVIDNQINPAFDPNSANVQIRSGVGVISPNQIVFVLSNEPVTFHQFARFFRDRLHCRWALYLDGAISRFYPFESPKNSVKSDFAGILAIFANGRRLPRGHSPGAPATSASSNRSSSK